MKHFDLVDDGTIDTVIACSCNECGHSEELRFNPEPPEDDDEDWDRVDDAIMMAESDFECTCNDDTEMCEYCAGSGIETPAEVKAVSIMDEANPTIIHQVCRGCLEQGGYREVSEDEIECSA